jgi:2-phospho-L-lactate guanylyltransferase (CobY/MobA/RfbA family)
MPIVAGVPVKSFAAAKMRLAAAIAADARIALSQEMARRTCSVLDERSDLNQAAASAVAAAYGQPWLVLHADLPLLDSEILATLLAVVQNGRSVIAPSRDGGTPAIGGSLTTFAFGYGPSSFRGHLRRLARTDPRVLVDPRLAIDLDEPSDLEVVRSRVPWIATILDSLDPS